jgi:hypothetical protein
MTTRPRKALAAIVVALVGLLAVAGCSADSANRTSNNAPAAAPEDGVAGGQGAGDKAAPLPSAGGVGTQAPVDERSLIYTGTMTVRVASVVAAADQAIAITMGLRGIVAGDNRTIDVTGSQATLVLRVPADQFTSTLDAFGRLGGELNRQVNAEDVTDQLVDLDARIATQQASVNRIRQLLAKAQTIADIVSLEDELTTRQADLDSLTQRRAKMGGLVSLATITLILVDSTGSVATKPQETGFMAGLRSGWHGFLVSVKGVLTVAGWLLPWLIAIGAPVLIVLWILRARRRRTRGEATPPVDAP